MVNNFCFYFCDKNNLGEKGFTRVMTPGYNPSLRGVRQELEAARVTSQSRADGSVLHADRSASLVEECSIAIVALNGGAEVWRPTQ